ncbi:MAG: class I SAM-dependent methyltransferase [Candidatus Micrarchaeota archaeon]|nr:class I SAM-dependent methyltransferase [Candidatus Micrarchaeota archaeon]
MGLLSRKLGAVGGFNERKREKMLLQQCRMAFNAQESLKKAKEAAISQLAKDYPAFMGAPEERQLLKIAILDKNNAIDGLSDNDILGMPDEDLLFKVWPMASYDRHMESTGHDRAVESLLNQLVSINRVFSANMLQPILGKNVLEASAGTGKVIRLLYDALCSEEKRDVRFTHNEKSAKMRNIAKETLADIITHCRFASSDLRKIGKRLQKSSFDTVLLSQTLHLIDDSDELKREKGPNYQFGGDPDRMQHGWEKHKVMQSLFDLVKPGGTFIIIDEWPPQFSGTPSSPLDSAIDSLFMNIFRPFLGKEKIYSMMNSVPGALLVADLRSTIDHRHSMSMLVYQKAEDPGAPERYLLNVQANVEAGIYAFRASEPFVAKAMNERFGAKMLFPMGENEPIRMNPDSFRLPSGEHGCILVHDLPHSMSEEMRNRIYARALKHIRHGGSIIIAEDGYLPKGYPRPLFDKNESYGLYEMLKFDSKSQVWEGGILAIPVKGEFGCLYMRQYWKY